MTFRVVEVGLTLANQPYFKGSTLFIFGGDAGASYFISQFSFGDLSHDEVLHSVDIFAREMLPRERVAQAV